MSLPARYQVADATQAERVADQLVGQLLTEDLLHIGAPLLHPSAGHIDACGMIKSLFEGDACSRIEILQAALNGWGPAREALGELVQEITESEWPSELKTFAKACANPHFRWPGPPGAKRVDHMYSDIAVVMVLLELSKRFPNMPTSSRSARHICHCDITAAAFNRHKDRTGRGRMSRGRVHKVWKRYKRLTFDRTPESKFTNPFN